MFSSLLKIDFIAETTEGRAQYVLTDHRETAEMAEAREISVLFALARMLGATAHAAKSGRSDTQVIYGCMNKPTPEVVEAIAACGGMLALEIGKQKVLPPVEVTPAELADTAFRSLANRALRATGLQDFAAALHALEAEIVADPPTVDSDEITYWTRVLELAALTGEIVRAEHGGKWVVNTEHADLPFAFAMGNDMLLPTNRAARLIDDGPNESMFLMLASARDRHVNLDDQPVLPSLRSRAEAESLGVVFRPLLEKAQDPELPVVVYGHDTPTSFGLLKSDKHEYSDEMHANAIANLAKQPFTVDESEIADVPVTVVSGGFFATEKLLDQAFMRTLERRHGELLAVIVPTRGLMFVASAMSGDPQRTMPLLAMIAEKESQTSRRISPAILLVQDGNVVGHAKLGDAEPPPPEKKPGLFGRLLGRR